MSMLFSHASRALARAGRSDAPRRLLNIHEYQSAALMKKYGVGVPLGYAASTMDEVRSAAQKLTDQGRVPVIKSQILAGGRGLGKFDTGLQGGVHVCNSAQEAIDLGEKMLGHRLITKQTGAEGQKVNQLYLVEKIGLKNEYYFAILMNREYGGPVMIGSSEGGTSIEDVAAATPEKIVTIPIDINEGITKEQTAEMAEKIGLTGALLPKAQEQFEALYNLFINSDATMVEVNPLGETDAGDVLAFDAKINFDDNAEFRQKDIFSMRDTSQEDARDVEAAKWDLNYIGLDGNIACLVNGAGLAMATMDVLKLYGGEPANFLDVGGGATAEQVKAAFQIITADPKVKAILVNIFGGIMRCDVIADGILQAAADLELTVPLVVRLQGTNVEQAKKMIAESTLKVIACDDLDEAATRAVQSIQ